jgi:transglutaminase-like putative cysteine protease
MDKGIKDMWKGNGMKTKGWIALACLLGSMAPAQAADERALQTEHEYVGYVVNADGSYIETRETAIKVLKESALEAAETASVSYSTSIQKADVVAAYTLKPDGRRIDVPASNYQVQAASGHDGDSPVYSDLTTLTVVFPSLAQGDTTVFTYRLTASQPMFPGQFSMIENFNPSQYYGDVRVTVDAPVGLQASHQQWQMQESRRERDGRRLIEWTWRNRTPVARESLRDSVFNHERYPGYAYSTFRDYAQIAQAYGGPANAKAAPTPRVRTLADEITGDAREPREVARRLYEWVSRNITYAGNCIGLGAVVPRDLDVVLDNRMGDCKDHATLLQALLTAKGIPSTQALINAGGTYTLPKVPVASVVNHVITYIPSLDLYADSTAATVPFGSLPNGSAGKPVLLVEGHHEGASTPLREAGRDGQKLRTTLRIAADGSVKGSQQVELSGRLAVMARDQFRELPTAEAAKMVRRYFERMALRADGTVRYPDARPLQDDFSIDADFEIAQMLPTSGGLQTQPLFISYAPIASIVARNLGSTDQPEGESGCGGIYSEEEYTIDLAPGTRIASLPRNVDVEEGNVAFRATYQREGNRIRISRRLDDRTPGPVCSPEYNAAYARTMQKILPGLREQIVYLAADVSAD